MNIQHHKRMWVGALCAATLALASHPLLAATWYVRRDGGTRYSDNAANGQCDGKSNAPYPGSGSNKHCAFNDIRYLWTDGGYVTDFNAGAPKWGWIGSGGDTYLIDCDGMTSGSCRIGQSGPNTHDYFGLAGNPYGAGAPPPPSGTSGNPTRILGVHFATCTTPSCYTHINGGFGVSNVFSMSGVSYVDFENIDITDFSNCGRAGQAHGCKTDSPLSDYASNGIIFSNASTNITLNYVRIHGLAVNGISGPVGDGMIWQHLDLLGNAASGWDADAGNSTTGKGSLLVRNFNISWNGCAEEYPIVDPIPYSDCTDQDHGGYGDGFGTAGRDSDPPGWQVQFDHGTVSYNTQDGLDALHIGGKGSGMTVTHVLAFGNMGQQIKVGGATATIADSVIIGNCRAMSGKIPGTPSDYNAKLSLFCRAGDTAIVVSVSDAQPAIFQRNIVYSNNLVSLEVAYPAKPTPNAAIRYDNNIFLGFKNSNGTYPAPIYSDTDLKMFTNPDSSFSHNTTFHANSSWSCPARALHEIDGHCGDPHLKDETWHPYGYPDTAPDPAVPGSSSKQPADPLQRKAGEIVWGSVGAAVLVTVGMKGFGVMRNRGTGD